MFHRTRSRTAFTLSLVGAALAVLMTQGAGVVSAQGSKGQTFGSNSSKITNRYLPITKFHHCVLAGNDQGQHLRIVRDLRDRTKSFTYKGQTVKTAVVVDRVTDVKAGRLIEKTVDYFAQDKAGNVYYFGEDVNEYSPNQPISHDGQWRLGRDTNHPGILMPAHPKVGDTYKAENAPGIAVETDKVVADGITRTVRGHTYHNVIKIREHATTPQPGEIEFKTYAPGTGVITEANGGVGLVSCR